MSAELEIIDLVVGEGKEAVKGALITTHYTGCFFAFTDNQINNF